MKDILKLGNHNLNFTTEESVDSDTKFRANEAIFSFTCIIKMFLKDYLFLVLVGFFFIIYLVINFRRFQNERKNRKLVHNIFDNLKLNLK